MNAQIKNQYNQDITDTDNTIRMGEVEYDDKTTEYFHLVICSDHDLQKFKPPDNGGRGRRDSSEE